MQCWRMGRWRNRKMHYSFIIHPCWTERELHKINWDDIGCEMLSRLSNAANRNAKIMWNVHMKLNRIAYNELFTLLYCFLIIIIANRISSIYLSRHGWMGGQLIYLSLSLAHTLWDLRLPFLSFHLSRIYFVHFIYPRTIYNINMVYCKAIFLTWFWCELCLYIFIWFIRNNDRSASVPMSWIAKSFITYCRWCAMKNSRHSTAT